MSFTDANTGTATGDNGTIIRTTDGGNSWAIQPSGTINTLYGVSFTDVNHGTAVGAFGTVVRTTDGGNTWSSQTSGTTNGLLAVSFTDANTGTAVGENGAIVRTTDGGNTWASETSGTTNNLNAVSFTDANNGTTVSWYGIILRTTDGGATWLSQESGTESFSMASRSRTQLMERPLAREAQFSEQQTAGLTGLRGRVGPPVSFGAFLLLTQTTEQPWVAMEPSCEQPMEETPGLARPAERPARF